MKYMNYLIITAIITLLSCQDSAQKVTQEDKQMAEKIKSEFLRSWNAYKTYAWGHDVLLPVSKGYLDWYEQ